jgi:phenylpropionate dioxygenase-like ring-hydroxylating dioxygenase large terminal subunit
VAYRHLNDFSVTTQSWYPLFRSRQIRRGRARTALALNRKLAIYRDERGVPHALDARCAHMGADLGEGRVIAGRLECPLHRWQYDAAGRVCAAPFEANVPPRRVRAYPAVDRHGFVWIFNGPAPLFEIPAVDEHRFRSFPLPSQTFSNHPHFLTANGLDWRHMQTLHDMELASPSTCRREGSYGVRVDHVLRPASRWLKAATGTRGRYLRASFETTGSNTAIVTVGDPPDFHLLFANTPLNNRTTRTRAIVFLPRRRPLRFVSSLWLYLILTFFVLLRQDHKIFQTTDFIPGFTDVDDAFALFGQVVGELPTY